MPKAARIDIRTTDNEKKKLQSMADLSGKNLSDYLLGRGLESNNNTNVVYNYDSLKKDLLYVKRSLHVLSKLTVLVVNDQYKDQELIKKFYNAALDEAEDLFTEE
jgi:hypothetical protein